MNRSSSVTYGMLIHSIANAVALTRCGNNPCFLRIEAFVRCVKPSVCSRSTLSQSWHRLTVLNHDSHQWSPGCTGDGFVVAGYAGDSPAAAAIAIWLEADAFPVVIVERSTGVQQQQQAKVTDACPILLDPVPVQQSGIS